MNIRDPSEHPDRSRITKGAEIEAFHPRMVGVIKHGIVVGTGPKYVRIDFGELLGGTFRVPWTHVLNPANGDNLFVN